MAIVERPLPKVGSILSGKFRVDNLIGAGAMGAVFSVTHCITGKRLAVKWLLPKLSDDVEVVDRFLREAKIAGRISHPNVVRIYDAGHDGDAFYFVMELLSGESLAYRLASQGAFTAPAACRLMLPILRGVGAAHAVGVIHRDLKPDNIFLCSTDHADEQPKILDFGVSHMRTLHGEVRGFKTRPEAIMGTPYYLAPEQALAKTPDARSDVYSLGVVLYQMLSNRLPFSSDKLPELLHAIVHLTPPPLAEIAASTPLELMRVVETAMAREPAQRFASALDFARALQPFAEPRTLMANLAASPRTSIERVAVPQRTPAPARACAMPGLRAKPTWRIAVVIGLALAFGASWLWLARRASPVAAEMSAALHGSTASVVTDLNASTKANPSAQVTVAPPRNAAADDAQPAGLAHAVAQPEAIASAPRVSPKAPRVHPRSPQATAQTVGSGIAGSAAMPEDVDVPRPDHRGLSMSLQDF